MNTVLNFEGKTTILKKKKKEETTASGLNHKNLSKKWQKQYY